MSLVLDAPIAVPTIPTPTIPRTAPVRLLMLDQLELTLLNAFQRDFPLSPRPYAVLAEQLGSDEASVLASLGKLLQSGAISRIGAVFRPNVIGASALAALAVPPERLEQVAACINGYPEINHNYEREHRFNLWFVATAPSAARLQRVFEEIEAACGCGPVLVLPMLEDFHIDLGFDLTAKSEQPQWHLPGRCGARRNGGDGTVGAINLSERQQSLISALQGGLALVPRPYAALGCTEQSAIAAISDWVDEGVIKRFGVVVRHHELGFTANAMVVWDIPDALVSALGSRIAESGRVTLCYRRPRHAPDWPYNLFCMVHGKNQTEVRARIAALSEICSLTDYPHTVLFSGRRFKQRGAYYASSQGALDGRA